LKNNKGFTLSEILVTLAIIGVVVVLSLPTLITKVTSMRYTIALKKEVSTLNQALKTNLANNDKDASDTNITSPETLAAWFVTGNASSPVGSAGTNLNTIKWTAADPTSVWISDGARFIFYRTAGGTNGCRKDKAENFTPLTAGTCYVIVDVNSDKKPNKIAIDANNYAQDVWILGINPDSVIPVIIDGNSAALPTKDINGGTLDPAYKNSINTNIFLAGNFSSYSVFTNYTPTAF